MIILTTVSLVTGYFFGMGAFVSTWFILGFLVLLRNGEV